MLIVTSGFITKDAASAEPNHKYDPDISTNIPWTTRNSLQLPTADEPSKCKLTGS